MMGETGKNIRDTLSRLLHGAKDLADSGMESVRTNTAIHTENMKIDRLYQRAGQELYEKFERTGKCDAQVRDIFGEIRRRRQTVEGLREEIGADGVEQVHTSRSGYADPDHSVGATGVCPNCGMHFVIGTEVCRGCGAGLKE